MKEMAAVSQLVVMGVGGWLLMGLGTWESSEMEESSGPSLLPTRTCTLLPESWRFSTPQTVL